jgi:hypothetical protein
MSLTLGPGATGDKLAAKQDVGTDVICEINGDLRTISGATDAYGSLFQGALGVSAVALVGPASGTDMIIDNIKVSNPGASTRIVTFYKTKNSTTYDATTQWATLTLLTGESAEWNSLGWTIYTAQGIAKTAPVSGGLMVVNASVAAQAGFAADTYLDGSKLLLPTGLIRAGTSMYWVFDAVKTAAGTAAVAIIIRFGTAGAIGDVARVTFTFSAQTGVVDRAVFEVWANFRSVGSGTSAVVAGIARLHHQLAVTGFNTVQPAGLQTLAVTSGGFDSTPAGTYAGLSVNGGSLDAVTVTVVQAQAYM